MVVCMVSSAHCSQAVGSWYWIYYVAPFIAAFLVAEVTNIMAWEVEEEPAGKSFEEELPAVDTAEEQPLNQSIQA